MPAKQKGVKLTPEQMRRITEIALARPGGGVTFSQAIREAVDMWLGESPQAMDAGEMLLLQGSRALRSAGRTETWKGAMKEYAGFVGEVKPDLESRINEYVATIPNAESRAGRGADRGEVRPSHKRKAS